MRWNIKQQSASYAVKISIMRLVFQLCVSVYSGSWHNVFSLLCTTSVFLKHCLPIRCSNI